MRHALEQPKKDTFNFAESKREAEEKHTHTSTHTIQSMPKHTHYAWQHA